jgi:hypothetical protein
MEEEATHTIGIHALKYIFINVALLLLWASLYIALTIPSSSLSLYRLLPPLTLSLAAYIMDT